ncbi:MAG: hypothetical protein ACRYFZ_05655, partial [Janthinobacterium lividum]
MRTYRKRVPQVRHCVHCGDAFESAHKRRIYCGNSCSTLAYYARQAHAGLGATPPPDPAAAPGDAALPTRGEPTAPAPLTLDWNRQNIAVLSVAAGLGQLGASLGKHVLDAFRQPSTPAPTSLAPAARPDPLDWLPAGLLAGAAPRVTLELPALGQSFVFVQLSYLGHTLFYQPSQRVLLWRAAPGQLLALLNADHVALVAEQPLAPE